MPYDLFLTWVVAKGMRCGSSRAAGLQLTGIDGTKINVDRAVHPIAWHDLTVSSYYMPVDLVWSCEVAEHIEEKYVDNYIDSLCNGKVIAMTHAVPGQDGHHHVNLKPKEYWMEKISARGYILSRDMEKFKKVSEQDVAYTYFRGTGLVFVRR